MFSLAQRKEWMQVEVHLRAGFTLTTASPQGQTLERSLGSAAHISVSLLTSSEVRDPHNGHVWRKNTDPLDTFARKCVGKVMFLQNQR